MSGIVNLFVLYKILRILTTPFEKWDAFSAGVLDERGNILIKKKERTPEQLRSFSRLHVLARNLKRMLEKLPFGKTRLASFAAALYLIKEGTENINEADFKTYLIESLQSDELYDRYETFTEEIANTVGSGSFAGLTADNPKGPTKIKIRKFAGCNVFELSSKDYLKCLHGKQKFKHYKSYVGVDEVGQAIRQYGRKNPKKPIIVMNASTCEMCYLRR